MSNLGDHSPLSGLGDDDCPQYIPQKTKWVRDPRWWWGWRDSFLFGIRWMDCGDLHLRGIVLGPISIFWERWDSEGVEGPNEEAQ